MDIIKNPPPSAAGSGPPPAEQRMWRHGAFWWALASSVLLWAAFPPLNWWPLAWVALLLLLPASDVAIAVVQSLGVRFAAPRRLPRLDFTNGVPEGARTMVVVPTLLTSVERVAELLEHLEVLALGNLDPRVHFAILSDFTDAPALEMPRDEAILSAAREGIEIETTLESDSAHVLPAVRALLEAGLRVPEDVSVVGFDDIPMARYVDPALTSVRVDISELGKNATDRLLDALAEPSPRTLRHHTLPTTLVVRRSCGTPPPGGAAR